MLNGVFVSATKVYRPFWKSQLTWSKPRFRSCRNAFDGGRSLTHAALLLPRSAPLSRPRRTRPACLKAQRDAKPRFEQRDDEIVRLKDERLPDGTLRTFGQVLQQIVQTWPTTQTGKPLTRDAVISAYKRRKNSPPTMGHILHRVHLLPSSGGTSSTLGSRSKRLSSLLYQAARRGRADIIGTKRLCPLFKLGEENVLRPIVAARHPVSLRRRGLPQGGHVARGLCYAGREIDGLRVQDRAGAEADGGRADAHGDADVSAGEAEGGRVSPRPTSYPLRVCGPLRPP